MLTEGGPKEGKVGSNLSARVWGWAIYQCGGLAIDQG
jgi:hypothetical protein